MQTHPSTSADSTEFRQLYRGSATHVRVMNALSLLVFAAGLVIAWMVMRGPSLALTSEAARLGWVATVLTFAGACPVWAAAYSNHVATRLMLSGDGRRLRVERPTLVGSAAEELPLEAIIDAQEEVYDERDNFAGVAPVQVSVRDDNGFTLTFDPGHEAEKANVLRALQH